MSAEATLDQRQEPVEAGSSRVRAWTLTAVCVTTFMLLLDVTVVNVGIPSIQDSLHASFTDTQWVIAAYTLSMAALLLTSGSLADRIGRKRVFMVGLAVFTGCSLLAGLAVNPLMLILARAVQGFGSAVLFAVGLALISQEFRGAKDRGMAFGLWGSVGGLAFAFGPLIGGGLTAALSWRWIFLVNVPIGVAMLVAGTQLRESRDPRHRSIDWAGMVLFGLSLALLLFAFMAGNAMGWNCPPIVLAFIFGAVFMAAFVAVQRSKGEHAMLDLSLFRIRSFNGVAWGTFACNAAALSTVFLLISYVQNVLGYSAWETGLRFMPLTLTLFVFAALTGRFASRISPGLVLGTAIAFIAVGLGLVSLVRPESDWTALLPALIVTGVGMGMFNPPRAAVTVGVVGPARAGMASGMGQTFQQVGVALGVSGFGALFQSCVVMDFTSSPAGKQLGGQADSVAHEIAKDTSTNIATLVPADLVNAASDAARTAVVHSMTEVIRFCALLAAIGAVLVFTYIRRRDLHETARGGGGGSPAEPARQPAAVGAGAAGGAAPVPPTTRVRTPYRIPTPAKVAAPGAPPGGQPGPERPTTG